MSDAKRHSSGEQEFAEVVRHMARDAETFRRVWAVVEPERTRLVEQLEAAHEALRGIERYAYDAIRDGHPSIPEMTVVQQRAMRAITSNPASREP